MSVFSESVQVALQSPAFCENVDKYNDDNANMTTTEPVFCSVSMMALCSSNWLVRGTLAHTVG